MSKMFSILSAALALGTLAALPALADSTPPAAPVQSTMQSGVKTDAKVQAPADEPKSKTKAAVEKKHEQIAEHPGTAIKTDTTVKAPAAKTDLPVKTDTSTSTGK